MARKPAAFSSKELEAETLRMELKLQKLKEDRDKILAQMQPGGAKSRWASAAPEKGPLRPTMRTALPTTEPTAPHAALHTTSAHAKPSASPRAAAAVSSAHPTDTDPLRKLARPSTAGKRDLVAAAAPTWSTPQVVEWLSVLGLSKYASTFEENEVNGSVLLDCSNADLDYLGIKPLAHRKILMKGVEQLRAACNYEAAAPARASSLDTSTAVESETKSPQRTKPEMVHWSHLEPLAAPGEGTVTADALHAGDLDEEAEAAAFKEAVMAWRRAVHGGDDSGASSGGRQKIEIVREYKTEAAGEAMWSNPFADPSATASAEGAASSLADGTYDEEAERKAFQDAVMAWRRGDTGGSAAPTASTTRDAGPAPNADEPKASCYHCFKVFPASTGYCPPVEELETEAAISDVSLADKSFCSEKCCHATRIALAQLRADIRSAEAAAVTQPPATHSADHASKIATLRALVAKEAESDDEAPYPMPRASTAAAAAEDGVANANVLVFGSGQLRSSPIVTSSPGEDSVLDLAHTSAQAAAALFNMPKPTPGRKGATSRTDAVPQPPGVDSAVTAPAPARVVDVAHTNFDEYI